MNNEYKDNGFHDRRREDPRLRLLQEQILAKLEVIENHQKESIELLALFKSTKGFITTLRSIGLVVIWSTAVTGGISALVYAFKLWLKGD